MERERERELFLGKVTADLYEQSFSSVGTQWKKAIVELVLIRKAVPSLFSCKMAAFSSILSFRFSANN